ncbi:hypothetical protein GCM10027597_19250 [Saccharopolyspora tripterygii]
MTLGIPDISWGETTVSPQSRLGWVSQLIFYTVKASCVPLGGSAVDAVFRLKLFECPVRAEVDDH